MESTRKAERLHTYAVRHWSRGTYTVDAKDATQAKRKVCKMLGLKPSDFWCGMSCFSAHRII